MSMTSNEWAIVRSLIRCTVCNSPNTATLHQIERLKKYYESSKEAFKAKEIEWMLKPPSDDDANFKIVQS